MGRNWATTAGADGAARIADPDDFVRLEVETALQRPEVTPIPVLVSGAQMPRPEQLPEPLRPLTRRNALELSDVRWRYDVGRLQSTLDNLLGEITAGAGTARPEPPMPDPLPTPTPVPVPAPAPRPRLGPPSWRLALEGMLLASVTAAVGRVLGAPIGKAGERVVENLSDDEGLAELATVVLRRGFTWALVAAVLAAWLVLWTQRGTLHRPVLTGLLVGAIAGAVSGAVYGVPVLLPEVNVTDSDLAKAHLIDAGSVAVVGAMLGALTGAIWRPPRLGVGLLCGGLAGGLSQLLLLQTQKGEPATAVTVLFFAIEAAAIVGGALAAQIALDRSAQPAAPE
jgi:hypothetical protein